MYILKIRGKREGIRADYVGEVIDYWRAVFRELLPGEGRVYVVITDIRKGSISATLSFYTRRNRVYTERDVPMGVLHEKVRTARDVFGIKDPTDIMRIFKDEFGVESTEIRRDGWRVGFGVSDIEEYRRMIHKEYGSVMGKVLAISALNPSAGVKIGIRWDVRPNRTIRVVVPEGDEGVFVRNYKRTVEVYGLIHYDPEGTPVRIEDIRSVVPVDKVAPPIDDLAGEWEGELEDSVDFVRSLREEWDED